ncbi:MAG: T9SS type A sorting domain-containing protein [Bacteroidia bacterium]
MKKNLQLLLFILFFANQVNAQDYRIRRIDIPLLDSINSITTSFTLSPDSSMYFIGNAIGGLGLFRYKNGICTQVNVPLPTHPTSICFKTANDYWVGSDSGLYHWDGNAWAIYDSLNTPFFKNQIKSIKSDSITGKSYFQSGSYFQPGNQICIFDGSIWTSIDSTNSPISNSLFDVQVDESGKIYYCTPDTIGIYDGISWQFLIADSIDDSYWPGNKLHRFTGFKLTGGGSFIYSAWGNATPFSYYLIKYTPALPSQFYYDTYYGFNHHYFFIDSKKNIWDDISDPWSFYQLLKFDGLNIRTFNFSSFLFQSHIPGMMTFDNEDNLWFCAYLTSNNLTYMFNENGFNTVSGSVFIDNNSNGVKDPGENNQKNILVHETTKNLYSNSDTSGYLLGFVDTSGSYYVQLVTPAYWTVTNSPATYAITQTHNNEKNTGIDFGIAPIGNVNDLSINGTMSTARPGFSSHITLNYKNIGTTTLSDTVAISLDSNLTYVSAVPTPIVVNGNYLQWVFTNLAPFDDASINLVVNVSTSATLGSTLTSYANIASAINDTTPLNNGTVITRPVTGSYDPNIKEVSPAGTGATGDVPLHQQLTYTVQFQNTGNDTAFKVVVRDSIDADLDLSTFNLVGYSHPVNYKINSERLVTFTFNNIMLPDSNTNELMSHGFVKYTISPMPNATSGIQIKNVAGIYFDFNSAVATNTTLNTLSLIAGIPSVNYQPGVSHIYPNPFITQTTISLNVKSTHVKIYDLTGRDVTSQCSIFKSANNDWVIKNRVLQSGIFIYKVFSNGEQVATGKLNLK